MIKQLMQREGDEHSFEHHGLPCRMARNHGGAWCGYIGVGKDHPLYAVDYSDEVWMSQELWERDVDIDKVGIIEVFCAMASDDTKMRMSLAFDTHGGLTYSHSQSPFKARDGRWWLGFDCSHSGDISPSYMESLGQAYFMMGNEVYRDKNYVIGVLERFANQLIDYAEAYSNHFKQHREN